ncbi:MAG: ribosome-associated translation inhibitor RaiA [Peptoclostridium sp.]|uniref:ribosome hibernation-promoting factor, HPF/YfiA family n=1 Tax=Peptoclostridium sp. TaxID=1904860 RepID=UPI00139D1B37|nr:ribosome-associated translation inhibitor RaiA [Peptoclostridium sp.]MZQ75893.1 ribosome-associated translation inhibitor RaiA [Peptoclostridium sp.]
MKVTVSGKNIQITDALQSSVETKLSKLEKYFNKEIEATATLSTQKNLQKIEVTIPVDGSILRGEEVQENLYVAIDLVVDKLARQLRKYKEKLQTKEHKTIRFENIEPYVVEEGEEAKAESKIVRRKRIGLKPMMEEEAVLQMELSGQDFYVFINAETDETNVVYKRKAGNYGIIEPE